MPVSAVQPVWQFVLSLVSLQSSQGLNRQALEPSDSEGRVTLLWMIGLTSVLDATSVIWFAPLE